MSYTYMTAEPVVPHDHTCDQPVTLHAGLHPDLDTVTQHTTRTAPHCTAHTCDYWLVLTLLATVTFILDLFCSMKRSTYKSTSRKPSRHRHPSPSGDDDSSSTASTESYDSQSPVSSPKKKIRRADHTKKKSAKHGKRAKTTLESRGKGGRESHHESRHESRHDRERKPKATDRHTSVSKKLKPTRLASPDLPDEDTLTGTIRTLNGTMSVAGAIYIPQPLANTHTHLKRLVCAKKDEFNSVQSRAIAEMYSRATGHRDGPTDAPRVWPNLATVAHSIAKLMTVFGFESAPKGNWTEEAFLKHLTDCNVDLTLTKAVRPGAIPMSSDSKSEDDADTDPKTITIEGQTMTTSEFKKLADVFKTGAFRPPTGKADGKRRRIDTILEEQEASANDINESTLDALFADLQDSPAKTTTKNTKDDIAKNRKFLPKHVQPGMTADTLVAKTIAHLQRFAKVGVVNDMTTLPPTLIPTQPAKAHDEPRKAFYKRIILAYLVWIFRIVRDEEPPPHILNKFRDDIPALATKNVDDVVANQVCVVPRSNPVAPGTKTGIRRCLSQYYVRHFLCLLDYPMMCVHSHNMHNLHLNPYYYCLRQDLANKSPVENMETDSNGGKRKAPDTAATTDPKPTIVESESVGKPTV